MSSSREKDQGLTPNEKSRRHAVELLINSYREDRGLVRLQPDKRLRVAALWQAREWTKCGFAHTQCGVTHRQSLINAGYPEANVGGGIIGWGYASADSMVQGWINSPLHEDNIVGFDGVECIVARRYEEDDNDLSIIVLGQDDDSETPVKGVVEMAIGHYGYRGFGVAYIDAAGTSLPRRYVAVFGTAEVTRREREEV